MSKFNNKSTVAMLCMVLSGLLFVGRVNAQTYNNTIVNDHSSWAILGYVVCLDCPVWTQYVFFDSDSTVVGYSYKKIFSYNDKLHENIKYEGLVREQNKKTYFIPANSQMEYLLYDFSLEAGMNFEYIDPWYPSDPISFYVKQVDFVYVNGIQKKRIQLAEVSFPYDENDLVSATWIEGTGSLNGLFYPCGVLAPGSNRILLCYFQNNELIYKNPDYSECYYDNTTSVQTIVINDCNVFPNPVNDILNISCLGNTVSQIEIFDNLGRKIYNQTHQGSINVSFFSKGLYLLKAHDTNGQVSVFKIIRK